MKKSHIIPMKFLFVDLLEIRALFSFWIFQDRRVVLLKDFRVLGLLVLVVSE